MTSFYKRNQISFFLISLLLRLLLPLVIATDLRSDHSISSCSAGGFCASPLDGDSSGPHHHHHDHHHHDHHHHHQHHEYRKLAEELAEEEDMKLYGFGSYSQESDDSLDSKISGLGLWLHAMGCSLLVSLASLICLTILPVIFIQGKPSKAIVDSLALFGAGAMLGDAFLHQLPHAFGGEHSHSHDQHIDHSDHGHGGQEHAYSHVHSLKDLSVGLSILAGIVLFLLVEKVVRYVEANSSEFHRWGHGQHHHHNKINKNLKDEKKQPSKGEGNGNEASDDHLNGNSSSQVVRKRKTTPDVKNDGSDVNTLDGSIDAAKSLNRKEPLEPQTNLVFGYLNLFSDGVHNFTDGMALGSAFLLYGSAGGWSRTLFLLAHELPQEFGDFGILVSSGFGIYKALFFNFLSALVALAGTALALLWGQDPGQSSLIEGFTAGGFIYIAVAGVLAEMNNSTPTLKSAMLQIMSLVTGMAVALFISLVE